MNSSSPGIADLVERWTSGLLSVRGVGDPFVRQSFIDDLSDVYAQAISAYQDTKDPRLFLIVSRPLEQHLCLYCSRGTSQPVVL